MPQSRQKIVIGVVFNHNHDSVLIAKRPKDRIKAGLWEFPGGKSENGESEFDTLSRELFEETGIEVIKARPLSVIQYQYSHAEINMSVWIVDEWKGNMGGKEGQQIRWCETEALCPEKFPEANKKLIKLLKLPLLYLITPDLEIYDEAFFENLSDYLENGLKLIQFRSPSLKLNERLKIAERLIEQCDKYKCRLIYNGSYEDAKRIGADGVHLSSKLLNQRNQYDTNDDFYIAGSCHNLDELEIAYGCNLDFCVLSPVNYTFSHSHSLPLGWDKTKELTGRAGLPVYALGGIKHVELERAILSGCYGISLISDIWNSDNGGEIVKLLANS